MTPDFHRIRRLPPYVFEEVNRLKARLRAQGVDIIDFGMGNPDMPTPKHIVDKLIETAQRAQDRPLFGLQGHSRPAPRHGRLLRPPLRREARPRHRGRSPRWARRRASPTWPRPLTGAGRRDHLPQPGLSDPRLRLHHGRRRDPPRAGADAGAVSVGRQPRGAQLLAAAERADRQLPVQPDRPVGRPRLLQGRRRAGEEARHAGAVRRRLFGNLLRKQSAAVDSSGRGRARHRRRGQFAVEDLRHGRLAGRAWWSATRACARRWRG